MFKQIIVLCFVFTVLCKAENQSNCSRSEFDEQFSKIVGLFGVKGVDFPTTDEEVDAYCSLTKNTENTTKDFIDRCLSGYSKTLMFIFNNNLREFLKQFCGKNPTERENLIEWSECGNRGKQEGTYRCWNRLMTNLHKTRKMEDTQDMIPAICCNFLTWKACTMNILKKTEECDESSVEGYESMIKKSTLDPLQALCDEYFEEPTMCIDVIDLMPRFSPSQRRKVNQKTPFLALFKIFSKLSESD